eukprot:jgi/Botrbrau1/10671/Bobra.139_2s0002.1
MCSSSADVVCTAKSTMNRLSLSHLGKFSKVGKRGTRQWSVVVTPEILTKKIPFPN